MRKIINHVLLLLLLQGIPAATQPATPEQQAEEDSLQQQSADTWEEVEDDEEETKPLEPGDYRIDSSAITVRSFDTLALQQLQQNPQLQYAYTKATLSLWDEFILWIDYHLSHFFSDKEGIISYHTMMVMFAILVLTYVIVRLLRRGNLKLFYRQQNIEAKNLYIIEEDIHDMDFEALLAEAIAQKDYRVAIRLYFLYGLKLLTDGQHIHWEPGKTNQDYVNELQTAALQQDFNRLNYYFEYAWYGNFQITTDLFQQVDQLFNHWRKQI